MDKQKHITASIPSQNVPPSVELKHCIQWHPHIGPITAQLVAKDVVQIPNEKPAKHAYVPKLEEPNEKFPGVAAYTWIVESF
ncbi:hypothetical protein GGI23_001128, partial [Coemansia sp. RSA 2559]